MEWADRIYNRFAGSSGFFLGYRTDPVYWIQQIHWIQQNPLDLIFSFFLNLAKNKKPVDNYPLDFFADPVDWADPLDFTECTLIIFAAC